MKRQSSRRALAADARKAGGISPRERSRLATGVRRQLDDIYVQFDAQLTRMAQIQLEFDRLRSKFRLL